MFTDVFTPSRWINQFKAGPVCLFSTVKCTGRSYSASRKTILRYVYHYSSESAIYLIQLWPQGEVEFVEASGTSKKPAAKPDQTGSKENPIDVVSVLGLQYMYYSHIYIQDGTIILPPLNKRPRPRPRARVPVSSVEGETVTAAGSK